MSKTCDSFDKVYIGSSKRKQWLNGYAQVLLFHLFWRRVQELTRNFKVIEEA